MIKSRDELFYEINSVNDVGHKVYIGKKDEIKGETFDTSNLFFATLFNYSINLDSYKTNWKETSLKYIFERIDVGSKIYYRELFSGIKMEAFDFSSLMRLKGMYLSEPISYDEYMTFLSEDKKSGRVRVLN